MKRVYETLTLKLLYFTIFDQYTFQTSSPKNIFSKLTSSLKQQAQYQLILNVVETWFGLTNPCGIRIRINNATLTY